mgnify:FL=1
MIYNLLAMPTVLRTALYAVLAILMLMVMITVHELGHYLVGKIFKFKINEFSIGMGPAIFKRKMKSGEQFSIRLFPFGGFCAFEGEDDDKDDPNAFNNKKPWQRILVLIAGAFMNYVLALLIIILSMSIYGQTVMGVQYARHDDAIYGQTIDSQIPADKSINDGEYILSITKKGKKTNVYMTVDLISALNHAKKGDEVTLEIMKGDKNTEKKTIILRSDVECKNITEVTKVYEALGIGSAMQVEPTSENSPLKSVNFIIKIGKTGEEYKNATFVYSADDIAYVLKNFDGDSFAIWTSRDNSVILTLSDELKTAASSGGEAIMAALGVKDTGVRSYYTAAKYMKLGFFRTIGHSFEYSFKIAGTVFRTLGQLLTGKLGLNAVGGTVTTIVTTTKVISYGFVYALEIMSFIGVNLAVFNLLPIPALDGARVVFCLIEWIRKKPVNRKIEAAVNGIGLILILGFAILVDILQFI